MLNYPKYAEDKEKINRYSEVKMKAKYVPLTNFKANEHNAIVLNQYPKGVLCRVLAKHGNYNEFFTWHSLYELERIARKMARSESAN